MARLGRQQGPSGAPARLGDVLPRSPAVVLQATWYDAVGARVASRSEVRWLHRGTLLVRVASSIWAQELALMSGHVIERLQGLGLSVKQLRFQVGELRHALRLADTPPPLRRAPIPANLQLQIAEIGSAELRHAVENAASALLGRARNPR